jgi:hypothetical protein
LLNSTRRKSAEEGLEQATILHPAASVVGCDVAEDVISHLLHFHSFFEYGQMEG